MGDQAISQAEPRGSERELKPASLGDRVAFTAKFVPFVWDPVHGIAAEFLRATWTPIHERGSEALAIVMQLSGRHTESHDEELAALYFTLVKGIAGAVQMPDERRNVFLQDVASGIYVCNGMRAFYDAKQFWDFLNLRHDDYVAAVRTAQETKPLVAAIDHFLCRFGLGGVENMDLVYGLYRFLSPLLSGAFKLLRDRVAETLGSSADG